MYWLFLASSLFIVTLYFLTGCWLYFDIVFACVANNRSRQKVKKPRQKREYIPVGDCIASRRPKRKCLEDKVPKYRDEEGTGGSSDNIEDGTGGLEVPIYKNPRKPHGSILLMNQICKYIVRNIPWHPTAKQKVLVHFVNH